MFVPINPVSRALNILVILNCVRHQLLAQLNILLNVFDTLRKQLQQIPLIQRIQLRDTEYQANRIFSIINKCIIEWDLVLEVFDKESEAGGVITQTCWSRLCSSQPLDFKKATMVECCGI
jgi:hypothetical protein